MFSLLRSVVPKDAIFMTKYEVQYLIEENGGEALRQVEAVPGIAGDQKAMGMFENLF